MKKYTVKQLSILANVSVRTLHYYDEIDLLKPTHRNQKGYRFYTYSDLIKLQSILFYKKLDYPLSQIGEILNQQNFNPLTSLQNQKQLISQKISSYSELLNTLDKTIQNLKNQNMTKELYQDFSPEEVPHIRQEAFQKYRDQFTQSEKKLSQMSPQERENLHEEGRQIVSKMAKNLQQDISLQSDETQNLIKQYHSHMNQYYDCTLEIFNGLADLYVQDERFTAYYEKHQEGLTNYISQAIKFYCKIQQN